jgi:hypothetical protein
MDVKSGSSSSTKRKPSLSVLKSIAAENAERRVLVEKANAPTEGKLALKKVFKKNICGDVFGMSYDSLLGLMYRARMSKEMTAPPKPDKLDLDDGSSLVENSSVHTVEIVYDSSDDEEEISASMNPRQQLAMTIRNWSRMAENDSKLIEEGAVQALVALTGLDDNKARKCCAGAFFHLSSRPSNRRALIEVGAGVGIITLSINNRNWSIAKLCALSLCYLSTEEGGEAALVKEGAIVALSVLLTVRNNRLLPICVQALYNLTCVTENFPGQERIIKALLTLPTLQDYDPTEFLVAALVNCSRFPSLRDRIIEDGALTYFFSLVNNEFGYRENKKLLAMYITRTLRSLSESRECRNDMISKGSMELLQQLLGYCDESAFLVIAITLFNLLKMVSSIPTAIFDVAVNVACELVGMSSSLETMQYVVHCLFVFTQERMRGISRLVVRITKALPKVLGMTDPLSQFYCIAASGNLFFSNVTKDFSQLQALLRKFIESGFVVDEEQAVRALVIALAKLSKEEGYMTVLHSINMLPKALELLLLMCNKVADDPAIQESASIAICSICLKLDKEQEKISSSMLQQIARLYSSLLHESDLNVLSSVVRSVRALMAHNICDMEMLQLGSTRPKWSSTDLPLEIDTDCHVVYKLAFIINHHHQMLEELKAKEQTLLASLLEADGAASVAGPLASVSAGESIESLATGVGAFNEQAWEQTAQCREESRLCADICRMGTASLAVISYVPSALVHFSADAVVHTIFKITKWDDETTRKFAAVCLCNLSADMSSLASTSPGKLIGSGQGEQGGQGGAGEHAVDAVADPRGRMIDLGVLDVLSTLCSATSEMIQELCARCICNLSMVVAKQTALIQGDGLDMLNMIGLVRSVSPVTKRLCVQAFLNLMQRNMEVMIKNGVSRALASLVYVDDGATKHACAKGFLVLSAHPAGRLEIAQRRPVQQACYSLITYGTPKTVAVAFKAVCNLLTDDNTRILVCRGGALPVLKIAVAVENRELRQCCARVILKLSCYEECQPYLAEQPIVPSLVLILYKSEMWARICATCALNSMSQQAAFRPALIEKNCIGALTYAVLNGKIYDTATLGQALRCCLQLSYNHAAAKQFIVTCKCLLLIHGCYQDGKCDLTFAELIVGILRNLSGGRPSDFRAMVAAGAITLSSGSVDGAAAASSSSSGSGVAPGNPNGISNGDSQESNSNDTEANNNHKSAHSGSASSSSSSSSSSGDGGGGGDGRGSSSGSDKQEGNELSIKPPSRGSQRHRTREVRRLACTEIVNQGCLQIVRRLVARYAHQAHFIRRSAVTILLNLGEEEALHRQVVDGGMMEMLISISQTAGIGQKNSSAMAHSDENEIGSDFHSLSPDDILCMVKAIDLVSHTAECREKIVSGGAVLLFNNLLTSMDAHVQVPLSIYFSPS